MIRRILSLLRGRPAAGTDAIVWGYRLFLDREPENARVVAEMAGESKSWSDLHRTFTTSPEYRGRVGASARPSLTGLEPPMQLDDVRDPAEVARLLDHIAATWTRFGDTEPHYSVITDEKFKADRIEGNLAKFHASGKDSVDRFDAALARAGLRLREDATCLELGCGVGRVTAWLARRCAKVLATDISASHLALARAHLDEENTGNVELHRLTGIDTIDTLPPFDVFFSVIVLQHNPPPVIRTILEHVFARLRPGGIAYFQVPTYRAGYKFRLEDYLRDDFGKGEMEMHVLPQSAVLRAAGEHGLELVEVIEDPYTGMRNGEVSNTFLLRKRER
jgi:SAM-dependent methyltransferase